MKATTLEKYDKREDFKLEELIGIANALMVEVAPVQPSDRVSETLSERTLRYYITEGLIDRPIGKEGTSALYSYRHLLQVLALKVLQASYLPMKRMRQILPGSTNEELKATILGARRTESDAIPRNEALSYLDSLNAGPEALEEDTRHGERVSFSVQSVPRPSAPATSESWERIVIEDGLELHVRSDRKGTLKGPELKRMIERALKSFRQ